MDDVGFYDALHATILKAKVIDVGLLLIRFLGKIRFSDLKNRLLANTLQSEVTP